MKGLFTHRLMKYLSTGMNKQAKRLLGLALAIVLFSQTVTAGIITVLPNNNATSGNGRAPQGSRLYINTVYIITPTEMAASGYGVDAISSVGWVWNNPAGAGAPTSQSVATTGSLKIWMQSTTDIAYTKGLIFSTAGMTKVFDGTITIPATFSQITIDLPVGGPGTSTFTTVAGEGVFKITDLAGHTIYNKTISIEHGINSVLLYPNLLAKGVYILSFMKNDLVENIKFEII